MSTPVTLILEPPRRTSTFRNGTPPERNATLTVERTGHDPETVLAVLRELTETDLRALGKFEGLVEGSTPVTVTLPRPYYDQTDALVARLRSAGCAFRLTTFWWVCPKEEAGDGHLCRPTCSVMLIAEVFS